MHWQTPYFWASCCRVIPAERPAASWESCAVSILARMGGSSGLELSLQSASSSSPRTCRHTASKGTIEDWVPEGHRFSQSVAYGDLGNENPAPITPDDERQADPVIELQLERAG